MEIARLVVYEKDEQTGMLKNQLASYMVNENMEFIEKVYAMKVQEGINFYLHITVDREVDDWEFGAIYDYYEGDAIEELGINIEEAEESYNPTWILTVLFKDSHEEMERKLNEILILHKKELEKVYDTIKDKKSEYKASERK